MRSAVPHRLALSVLALAALLLLPTAAEAGRDPIVCTPNGEYVQPPEAPDPVELDTGLGMDVWEGGTPPDLDPDKPVLVLVHGLHGSAHGWFDETMLHGINDFYDHAYDHGYKTFMVDLWDARDIPNPGEDGIDNGRLLRDQIEWIVDYWGISEVNVVAHSKGGVDSNIAALMGAPIDTMATLSGAHWGSPLADLAQSDLWPEWLQDLIGYNDDGTKFMQTACMEIVRGIADARPENEDLHIYTFAGTDWGPDFSYLALAGAYLGTPIIAACPHGPLDIGVIDNDGVVCVEHAMHPWARNADGVRSRSHRIVWDDQTWHEDWELDHDNIRTGAPQPEDDQSCHVEVFESVEKYVGVFHVPGAEAADAPPAQPAARSAERVLGHLFRGGELAAGGRAETAFPVEDGVARLQVGALATTAGVAVELVSPSGRAVTLPAGRRGGGPLFGQAFVSAHGVSDPEPGLWRARVSGGAPAAWGLLVGLVSPPRATLSHRVAADGAVELALDAPGRALDAEASLRRTSVEAPNRQLLARSIDPAGERLELPGDGVYNLRVTVRGETAAGLPWERSGVVSLAAGGATEGDDDNLPGACK